MKALLIKDAKLMKGQKNFFFMLFFIVIAMAIFSEDIAFSTTFPTFILTMFAISSISYDEIDNGYAFLFTLPMTRNKYVIEKYLFGTSLGVLSLIFTSLLNIVALLIKDSADVKQIFFITLAVLPAILLILSIVIPIQLKYGAEKGRLALFLIFGGVSLGGIAMSNILATFGVELDAIFNSLTQISVITGEIILILISLIICFISIKISQSIMLKKEF